MSKDQMLKAIDQYFSDTSRSVEETKDGLEEARDTIEMLLQTM